MPIHSGHTHCQVTQSETQSITWQRVCLFHSTVGRKNNEGTTKCINHWAESAGFKMITFNQPFSNLTGKSFEMPNASYTDRCIENVFKKNSCPFVYRQSLKDKDFVEWKYENDN